MMIEMIGVILFFVYRRFAKPAERDLRDFGDLLKPQDWKSMLFKTLTWNPERIQGL